MILLLQIFYLTSSISYENKLVVDADDISNGNCSDNVAISGSYCILIDSEMLKCAVASKIVYIVYI